MKHILAKLNLLPSAGSSVPRQLLREIGKVCERVGCAADLRAAPRRRLWWDRRRDSAVTFEAGAIAGRDRFAIYLVHQPDGILESTLTALEQLTRLGLAPLVVSNAPVAKPDLARIRPLALGVLERPNLGYDFGGYRDGVWWLERNFDRASEMLFLNDSTWFPAVSGSRALQAVLAADGDAVGLFGNTGAEGGASFVDSFFVLVRGPICASGGFRAFWREMPLYAGKQNVVRRCESRLSRLLCDEARGVRVLHDWSEVRAHLPALGTGDPIEVLDRLFVIGANRRFRLDALRAEYRSGDVSRERLWSAVIGEIGRGRPFETFAYLGLRDLDYGILKKKYMLGKPFGAAFLALSDSDGLTLDAAFERELRTSLPRGEAASRPAA